MTEPLIPGCPLPDPDVVRARISELDDQAAALRRLLRLLLRIQSRPNTDKATPTRTREGVARV